MTHRWVGTPEPMTLVPCLDCGGVVANPRGGRCPKCATAHATARAARRPSSTARGYDWQWHLAVQEAIRHQPWCSECGTPGDESNPLTGDHIRPLAAGGTNDPDNIDVLCRRHNSAKSSRWQGQRWTKHGGSH